MNLASLSDHQIFDIAEPIWETQKRGSNAIDHETFSSHFAKALKEKITKERLEKQCEQFPLLTSLGPSSPVACIRRKEGVTVLFRQLSTTLEGEFIGQLTLSGTSESHEVIDAQVY